MKRLGMDSSFVDRYLNEGFSGGEKKRNEIMQMAILEPELAILDETDSGLDIDALRIVAKGIREIRSRPPEMGVVLITHYQRLLDEVQPDHVHILVDGRIVASGGMELAAQLERDGYEAFRGSSASSARHRRDHAQQFPLLQRADRRRADRLPRLGQHVAEAAVGHRRDDTLHGDVVRTDQPQRLPPRRRGHRRLRGRPQPRSPASSTPRAPTRSIFTKNATEALNLVAYSRGAAPTCSAGDVVVLTHMEHHANIVPWHMLAAERGIELRWVPLTADGQLDLTDLDRAARRRQGVRVHGDEQRARHASRRCASCATRPTPPARWPSSTPASTCRTTSPTCRPGTPTSSRSAATRCAGRRASACCGAATSCSTRCRRSSAAAT